MTNKKYEFVDGDTITTPNGKKLKRIRALVAIGLSVAAAVEMMQTVMSMTPDWLQGAPIACDVGCDISYGKI